MPKPKLAEHLKKSSMNLSLRKDTIETLKNSGNASAYVEKAVEHYEKYLKRRNETGQKMAV